MAETIVVDIEFKTNVQKISKDLESVKDSLSQTNESLDDISKNGKGTESALKKIGKGFRGVSLAMKALGVGLIIEAFNFLKDILLENQVVVDALSIATETIGVVFLQISTVLTDVFNAVSESTEGFEGLKAVMSNLLTLYLTPFKLTFYGITLAIQEGQLAWEQSWLGDGDPATIELMNQKILETKENLKEVATDGLDAVKGVAENIGEAVTEVVEAVTIATEVGTKGLEKISVSSAIKTGKALAEAKKNEELLEVLRAKEQLESQLEAERQRQIRDDIRLTFDERIAANEELGRILEEQTKKELEFADEKVRIAQMKFELDETNVANEVEYQKALLEQIDINERIEGQKSEQKTNEAALQKELEEARKEVHLATMSDRQQELQSLKQDYDAKLELARQSGLDTVALTEQYNNLVLEANEKFAQEDLDVQKKLDDEKSELAAQQLDVVQNSIKMAGNLFAEGSAASKVAGIASATIDTYKAANMALASAPPPLSYIAAALSIATGLKSVKEIMSVKTPKPTAGGGGGLGGGSIPSGRSGMSDTVDMSAMPSLGEQFTDNFMEDTPVQAFVVEQDVTNSQQINTMIQQKATL